MTAPSPPQASLVGRDVVFFDGVCVLCNGAVQFIRRHDRARAFRFATLQGDGANHFFASRNVDIAALTTVYLVTAIGTPRERVLSTSSAALAVARKLPWPWRAAYAFAIVPRPIRDWCYRFIASRRYRWFGRHEACPIPTAADRATLVDDEQLTRLSLGS